MSLNPFWMPESDEDQRRKAEIEEMMRNERARYFRDEPVQQEYRDILTREADRSAAAAKPVRVAGPFDEALARFKERSAEAGNPVHRPDASETSFVFDGGEREAKTIFRRNDETTDNAAEAFSDSGVGKGDRLPVSRPESRPSPSAFDPGDYPVLNGREDGAPGLPVGWQNNPLEAFEVEPSKHDGMERVMELQGQINEHGRLVKDRPYALKKTLKDQLNVAAQKAGLVVEVHSGGQVAKGEEGRRYKDSGPRHNHGNAGDVDLLEVVNGVKRKLDAHNSKDRKKMADFIQYSVAAGVTGVGFGYMGPSRIHVGGGKEFVWRDTKEDKKLNAPLPWVAEAVAKGKALRPVLGAVEESRGLVDVYSDRNPRDPGK